MATLQLPEGYTVRKVGNSLKVVPQRRRKVAMVKKEEKGMFEVGQIVKLNRQFGDTVCLEVLEVGEKIKAKLVCTRGVYEYEKDDLQPASKDDIELAAKQWQRNVEISQEGMRSLERTRAGDVPLDFIDFGMFDDEECA